MDVYVDKLTHSLCTWREWDTLALRSTETDSLCSLVRGVNQSIENVVFVLFIGILSPLANHFLEDVVHFYTCSVPLPETHTHTRTHTHTHTHTQHTEKERVEGREEETVKSKAYLACPTQHQVEKYITFSQLIVITWCICSPNSTPTCCRVSRHH